jgi:outer membrane protein OmpA-like peptidoglycan-associated protein
MTAALRDNRPASELDQAELRDRLQALRAAMQSGALPNDQRRAVQARIQADREVAQARRAGRLEEATPEQPQQREQRARSEVRPQQEVERRAREIIADKRAASDLDSNVLRERLANNRELLGTEQLSRTERQQLRNQLQEDREELRARVAARQEEQDKQEEARAPARSGTGDRSRDTRDRSRDTRDRSTGSDGGFSDSDVARIIEERTPSSQLTERELEQRVRVLQRALDRGNITVRQAEVARLLIDRDRDELRSRLYADRERRRDRWRTGSRENVFIEFEVGYRPPPVIYAAEAMPRDIQMQLVAPPLYQTQRAYSAHEIATNHDVREMMPGIEIDTLNFDFGSAEVRPEEIDKLDAIGEVIERIVAERPDEVFLIEGHTDAVGSHAANDALSQRRAQAVVEALLDYFIIDPENLQTVGLGKRYLRINTPYAEEENRRVTVRRITPLLAGRG